MAIVFTSGVLDPFVLPTRVNLLLQGNDSMGQPVGDHANSDHIELFQLADLFG
jgi:hypothetical protein